MFHSTFNFEFFCVVFSICYIFLLAKFQSFRTFDNFVSDFSSLFKLMYLSLRYLYNLKKKKIRIVFKTLFLLNFPTVYICIYFISNMFPFWRFFWERFFSIFVNFSLFLFFFTFKIVFKPSKNNIKCGGESVNIPIKKHAYNEVYFRRLTIHKWPSVVNNLIINLMLH